MLARTQFKIGYDFSIGNLAAPDTSSRRMFQSAGGILPALSEPSESQQNSGSCLSHSLSLSLVPPDSPIFFAFFFDSSDSNLFARARRSRFRAGSVSRT